MDDLLGALSLTESQTVVESHLERSSQGERTYAEFLCDLLEEEIRSRTDRNVQTRLKLARLPFSRTLEQFDFGFQPSIDERRIRELQTLRFVYEASNVIFLGPPGGGKDLLIIEAGEEEGVVIAERVEPPFIRKDARR